MYGILSAARAGFRNESGVAAVEFALVVPVLLILTVGVIDGGNFLLKYRHAFQTAASLAETGARLSIANRTVSQSQNESDGDGDRDGETRKNDMQQSVNMITQEQSQLLSNGVRMVMGEMDPGTFSASARRVVRSRDRLTTDWIWSYDSSHSVEKLFPLNKERALSMTADGESIMIVDVAFDYQFLFKSMGFKKRFTAQYTAGVPSY